MGKQHDKHPFADNPFLEGLAGWMDSPAGELSTVVLDAVWALLEKVEVDAKQRKIIWEDGQQLSITESVHRIHAGYPDFPLELIETHLLGWLEMDFVPLSASPEQLHELDRLTESWIADHERRAEAARKRGRTRHS